ncbi:TrmB family transcriptional regulator [Methanolapillus ohkumae]|uniref:TrmB family transcriptional regulator n=1 Tax=Methanolapillus ohkumae TaxID=3028298 RepID=A0AA96ZW88_9EURY|nr:hypothetical protein MsAm2_15630 [Methanosarcinaceae archaeon Am2]
MIDNELISNLKKIGFAENEAKAYVGLVMLQEAGARELHGFTNIPRAKIYEVLDRLVEKKYAEILYGTPIHYKPTDPDELILMIREDFEKTTDFLLDAFDQMEIEPPDNDGDLSSVWYLRSDWTVRNKIRELFEKTDCVIIICNTPEVLFKIEDLLNAAQETLRVLILVNDTSKYDHFSFSVNLYPPNIVSLFDDLMGNTKAEDGCFIISNTKAGIFLQNNENKLEGFYMAKPAIGFIYKTIGFMLSNLDSIQISDNYVPNLKSGTNKLLIGEGKVKSIPESVSRYETSSLESKEKDAVSIEISHFCKETLSLKSKKKANPANETGPGKKTNKYQR